MNKIVVKFGGSNLKSTDDIRKIIRVVKQYKTPIVIIVSAFFGLTDKLSVLIDPATKSKAYEPKIIDTISQKYQDSVDVYIQDTLEIDRVLSSKKQLLKVYLKQLKQKPNCNDLRNKILSFGEVLSALVISAILQENMIKSKAVLPEQIGLISNNNLDNATVPFNSDFSKLRKSLACSDTLLIPGFYAQTESGKTSVFGGGGSDYTAAIIAYAIQAKSVDLWKDVSGFLSADPKIVAAPKSIKHLSYLEAAELSYFGASIIHPGTIRPLIKANIPLHIFDINTKQFDKTTGTCISSKNSNHENQLKSITYNTDFVLLRLKGAGVGIKKGILSQITQAFDLANINIRSVITSQIEIDFLIHRKDLQAAYGIAQDLQDKNFDIEQEDDIALIAAVGHGIKQAPGIAGKIFGALAKQSINIRHIVFGASEVAIYLIADKSDLQTSIRAIHVEVFPEN